MFSERPFISFTVSGRRCPEPPKGGSCCGKREQSPPRARLRSPCHPRPPVPSSATGTEAVLALLSTDRSASAGGRDPPSLLAQPLLGRISRRSTNGFFWLRPVINLRVTSAAQEGFWPGQAAVVALGDLRSRPTACRVPAGEALPGLLSAPTRCVHLLLCSGGGFPPSPSPLVLGRSSSHQDAPAARDGGSHSELGWQHRAGPRGWGDAGAGAGCAACTPSAIESSTGSLPVPASPRGHGCSSPQEGTCRLLTPMGEGCRDLDGGTPAQTLLIQPTQGKRHTDFWAQS